MLIERLWIVYSNSDIYRVIYIKINIEININNEIDINIKIDINIEIDIKIIKM